MKYKRIRNSSFLSSFVEFVEIVCYLVYNYYGDYMNRDNLVFLFNNIIKDTKTIKNDYESSILKINR